MTGYGFGEASRDGFKVTVEVSSVNRKQSEISLLLPRELEVLEAQIRDAVNRRVARGRVTVRVALHAAEGRAVARAHLNRPLAEAYAREFSRLIKELGLQGGVSIEALTRSPGVLQSDAEMADAEDFWPAVEKALRQALHTLVQMREREGLHLQRDLCARVTLMRKLTRRVRAQAPKVMERYRAQLLERVRRAGLEGVAPTDERVVKEIVFFADRSDISEELTRLESHFAQFDTYVESKEPIGRTLDFLAQELNREINTLGAKASDPMIARLVVTLKTELEKFREQVQNLE